MLLGKIALIPMHSFFTLIDRKLLQFMSILFPNQPIHLLKLVLNQLTCYPFFSFWGLFDDKYIFKKLTKRTYVGNQKKLILYLLLLNNIMVRFFSWNTTVSLIFRQKGLYQKNALF